MAGTDCGPGSLTLGVDIRKKMRRAWRAGVRLGALERNQLGEPAGRQDPSSALALPGAETFTLEAGARPARSQQRSREWVSHRPHYTETA